MTPEIQTRRLAKIIERYRIDVTTEDAAQRAIAACLVEQGCEVEREVRLTAADRIDLMADGIGIEVKVKGRRRMTYALVVRYLESNLVCGLILVTAKAFPLPQRTINGKPFEVVDLSRAWL